MPNYPEIRANVREVRRRIRQDQNSPYRVRRRKINTQKDSRGGNIDTTPEYEYRTITDMLTQPLSRSSFQRLPEGLKTRKPRFVAIIPPGGGVFKDKEDMLDEGEQVEYLDEWYEATGINNWDLIMHAHMVVVK